MSVVGIIPARYGSTRLPGKALADIHGKSMIQRVYEQVVQCKELNRVIIATDDERIMKAAETFGAEAMMTDATHQSGTDRCGEVLQRLDMAEVIINIQGDEPLIDPGQISELVQLMKTGSSIGTLVRRIESIRVLKDPGNPKVVFDTDHNALYFSRQPIPFMQGVPLDNWLQHRSYFAHIGMYGYQAEVLRELIELKSSPLEQAESLEQLRWLEHGYEIKVAETTYDAHGVDTPEDLEIIRRKYDK